MHEFYWNFMACSRAVAGTGEGESVVALYRNMGKTDKRFTPWGIR